MSIEQKIAELLEESRKQGLSEEVVAEEEQMDTDPEEEVSEVEVDEVEAESDEDDADDVVEEGYKGKKKDMEEGIGDIAQGAVNVVKKVAGVATGAVGAATGAMDGAVKGARKSYKATAESKQKMKEDLDALTNGEELSEEFKTKAETIFEAAVVTRVNEELVRLEEEFETRLSEAVEKNVEGLVEQVDGYLGYVAEQWIAQNELALERGMKSEILENFVGGLKSLFEENYIEMPEERFDVLGTMEQQIEDLEEKLNEQVATNIQMKKVIEEASRKEIAAKLSEDLSDTEKEKFFGLVEELSFDDVETFEKKAQTIRENYFTNKSKTDSIVESVVTDEPVENLHEEVNYTPQMKSYLSALSHKS